MFPGTTPTVTLKFKPDSNFDNLEKILITFKSLITEKKFKRTFETDEITVDNSNKTLSVRFEQEETLQMSGLTSLEVQVRFKYKDTDNASITDIKQIPVGRILEGGVI